MKEIMNPLYIDNTIKELAAKYNKGTIRTGLFLESFISFEKVLREHYKEENPSSPLTIAQMSRELLHQNVINQKEYIDIINIKKLRNIILHGGDVPMVEKDIDDKLKEITHKITTKLKNRRE